MNNNNQPIKYLSFGLKNKSGKNYTGKRVFYRRVLEDQKENIE